MRLHLAFADDRARLLRARSRANSRPFKGDPMIHPASVDGHLAGDSMALALTREADRQCCKTARAVGVALAKGDRYTAGLALAANREARARSRAWHEEIGQ